MGTFSLTRGEKVRLDLLGTPEESMYGSAESIVLSLRPPESARLELDPEHYDRLEEEALQILDRIYGETLEAVRNLFVCWDIFAEKRYAYQQAVVAASEDFIRRHLVLLYF